MFDIGALELLMIVIVAVLVIGPKDMPGAMRTAGRWIGQVRKVSAHFRTGVDAMVREAELEDMEKKWKARNDEIMRKHPTPPSTPASTTSASTTPAASAESAVIADASEDASEDAVTSSVVPTEMTGPPPTKSAEPSPVEASSSSMTGADAPNSDVKKA